MRAKAIQTPMYLAPEQKKALDRLSEVTRVPRAVLVREAVDDLLTKYRKELRQGRGTR